MARRPSPKPVTPATALRLVVIAIRRAGGTAGDPIDGVMKDYEETMRASAGAQLSTLQIGIFAANQPVVFNEFYRRFAGRLEGLLRDPNVNWVGNTNPSDGTPEALQKCLDHWKINTTLGEMAADPDDTCLVNDFDDKVVYVDPAPIV